MQQNYYGIMLLRIVALRKMDHECARMFVDLDFFLGVMFLGFLRLGLGPRRLIRFWQGRLLLRSRGWLLSLLRLQESNEKQS